MAIKAPYWMPTSSSRRESLGIEGCHVIGRAPEAANAFRSRTSVGRLGDRTIGQVTESDRICLVRESTCSPILERSWRLLRERC